MAWSKKAIEAALAAYWNAKPAQVLEHPTVSERLRAAIEAAAAVDGEPAELREQLVRMSLAVQRDCDAEWNAAIEAAAKECEADEYRAPDFHEKPEAFFAGRANAKEQVSAAIRSLKRP